MKEQGEYGTAGPGDLYLFIHMKSHPEFERHHNDLHMQLPVSFVKAALGGEVTVPTLSGDVAMKVPSGTQSGKVFRLKGKGMPDLHGGPAGDQYAKVMLQVPVNLSGEQRRLLEEYARVSGEMTGADRSFSEKIKKVFK
jgi:molecular chaperone DnaJ